jgi:8-oxo-dGTP pyrophosphatase MutT (NUDIX family)/IS5 family transposase
VIKAAGIFYLTPDNQALFLQRGNGGDCAGMWCFPGGKTEDGETEEQAARREAREEAGDVPDGTLVLHTRSIAPAEQPSPAAPPATGETALLGEPVAALVAPSYDVDFTTFIQRVDAPFPVTICDESIGYAWADISSPPEPLHPGCRLAIDRLAMHELDVARAMSEGRLTSPQRYHNMSLFAIRITGTGVAYRSSLDEFAFRDPSLYLNEEFLARCAGLAVIWQHPGSATLDSKEYADRAIGSVLLPYIKGDEVWGIAKVYDDAAIEIMTTKAVSTSPCVAQLDPATTSKMTLEDGSALLIEGKPAVLDHIAICPVGVWDKGGEPMGVISDSICGEKTMADEAEKKTEETKADAAPDFKSFMDAVTARLDSMESGMKAKADADDEKAKGEPDRVAADAKKDADEADEKAKADAAEEEAKAKADAEAEEKAKADAKADSDVRARIDAIEKLLPRQLSDADRVAMSQVQERADSVFRAFGDSASPPMAGEDIHAYRRRLAGKLQPHSAALKGVNLNAIQDAVAFDHLEAQIYSDASAKAMSPADVMPGTLREHVSQDVTGRKISTFSGEPSAWMSGFTGQRRRVTGISKGV